MKHCGDLDESLPGKVVVEDQADLVDELHEDVVTLDGDDAALLGGQSIVVATDFMNILWSDMTDNIIITTCLSRCDTEGNELCRSKSK